MIPEEKEKFTIAIQFIVEGSITCLRQSEDNKLFRFIKSSINNENLMSLRKRINELYLDLMLTTIIDMRKDIPSYLPIPNAVYPVRAVGIEMQVNEILDILRSTDQLSLAVVIYGFGGLGKTTLAEAVVSKMDLKNYNYSTIEIYQEQEKNDFTRSQQRILKDCFPNYNGGKPVVLTDYKDGRGHLWKAFKCQKEKPIFLFIDNALRLADLKNLLPEELEDLPRGSKILVTTRILQATDIFEGQPNLVRRPCHLQPLPDEETSKILFKNQDKAATIRKEDLKRILKICSGVPLALKIVGAQLHKQNYRVDRCSNILEILEKGDTIKEEKLSERLVDFVYGELEVYSREAWLDICCFFSKWSRQDVEYIVGAMAVTSLLETGLISSTLKRNHPAWEELIVHDIIKAKGQALAKGNRILDVQSLSEAVDEQRLHQIKGVWLSEDGIEEKHLKLMRKSLRVLALGEGMEANRVSQMRFEELKFLQLSGNIAQLDKLDKLRVFHGPFFTEGGVTLCKLPRNLSSMKVICQFHSSECTNSQMRGASPCPPLEKLDFSELVVPLKLPEGFNQLVALNILILDDNEKMRELPEQICQLPALEVLSMRRCWRLKRLPESIFGLL
ncbi:disease resistance protein RPV1-like [Cryptomeria japonica]|uniref:disease resistance protein RPV1-like n=1 Tax=Cryptomeria japonica TaxID=3369 RepID=UPI0027DA3551|nr:disease resistance protein RPV1-like [Cryptomeria japonica]